MQRSALSEQRLRLGLTVFAVVQLVTGLGQVLTPGAFFDSIADFGVRNDHYLRDVATYYLASGVALLLAVRRPSWRVPVLFLVTVQYALHALNHLLDVGKSDPGWVGPFDFITLAIGAFLLGCLLQAAARQER